MLWENDGLERPGFPLRDPAIPLPAYGDADIEASVGAWERAGSAFPSRSNSRKPKAMG
jgi:hypothetical protein